MPTPDSSFDSAPGASPAIRTPAIPHILLPPLLCHDYPVLYTYTLRVFYSHSVRAFSPNSCSRLVRVISVLLVSKFVVDMSRVVRSQSYIVMFVVLFFVCLLL